MRKSGFYDPKRRIDVRLHRGIEIFGRNVQDRLTRLLPGGVANKNVKPAELVDCVSHEFVTKIFVAKVTGNRDRFRTRLFDERYDFVRVRLLSRKIIDRNIRAFAREGDGSGPSNPRVAAGDQRFPTGQP